MLPYYKQRNTTAQKRFASLSRKFLPKGFKLPFEANTGFAHDFLLVTLTTYLELLRFFFKTAPDLFNDFDPEKHAAVPVKELVNFLTDWDKAAHKNVTPMTIARLVEAFPTFPGTDKRKTTLYTTPWAENARQISQFFQGKPIIDSIAYMFKTISPYLALYSMLGLEYISYPEQMPLFILDALLAYFNAINFLTKDLFLSSTQKRAKIHHFLPKYYRRPIKIFYTKKATVLSLANFINSKKKAKKYLRILHKRLGLYTHKKVAWRQ